MATAAKFVQPIPIILAYLISLAVGVVPIKLHQFLFGNVIHYRFTLRKQFSQKCIYIQLTKVRKDNIR
jgi:hypothetical protein